MSSQKGIILGFLFFFCFVFVTSEPSEFFSKENADFLTKRIKDLQKSDGSWLGLKNTFFAVSSLKELKQVVPNQKNTCEFVKNAKVVDAESAFYFISLSEQLGCGENIAESTTNILKKSLKSNSLWDIYHGAMAVFKLKDRKAANIADDVLISAVNTLLELEEDDATFKFDSDSEESSAFNSGLAYQVFAEAVSKLKMTPDLKEKIGEVLENSGSLETGAEGDFDDKTVGSLRATATVFKGINDLATALKEDVDSISGEDVVSFAEFFMKYRDAASPENAFFFLTGIKTCANNKFGKPLVVSLQSKTLSLSSKTANAKISVTDLYGSAIKNAKVILAKASSKKEGGGKLDISNQEIPKSGDHFEFNLKSFKPEPGLYQLELRVLPEDEKFQKVEAAVRDLRILGSASVSDLQIKHLDSKDTNDIIESYSASYPSSVKDTIKLEHFQHLLVEFKIYSGVGRSIDVQQAFLIINNTKTGKEHIVIAQKKKGIYQAQFSVEEITSVFSAKAGEYELSLLIGDAFIENSFWWKLGKLQIRFSKDAVFSEPESPFEPKPTITWTFREPEKRPSKFISSTFTGIVLFPILIFFIGLIRVGANIKNFPFDGMSFLFAVGFQGCIGLILALYALYWLKLNMKQTLFYLGILLVPTLFFGNKTLNRLSKRKKD